MTEPGQVVADVASRERTWASRLLNTHSLFQLLYAVALFVVAVRPTLDPDMWWHLRTGEYILQNGIPRQDVFSYTVTDHAWVTHEWLSQTLMWLLYEAGGFAALILIFAAVIAASFWLVFVSSAGRPFLAAFTGLLAAFAAAPTWGARPQMFNILFLALFVYIVEGMRQGRFRARAFWWFPMLTAVWANLHSGYLTGVALLAGYAVGHAAEAILQRRLPAESVGAMRRPIGALALAAGASLLAAALNPNGFELWVYPFETLSSPAMQQFIQEWHPPELRLYIFWPFAALLLLGVVGWAFGRRPELTDVLLLLGTGAAALLSARNVPLFAVVAVPIVSRTLWQLWECARGEATDDGTEVSEGTRPALLALNFVLLAVFVLVGALWVGQTLAGNEEAVAAQFPVEAVNFLEAQGLEKARGFNEYGWGGYLIWRGFPVFVDGRADVYGDDFLFFYQQAAQVQADWREPLERYSVEYALVGRRARLATMLAEVEGWQEVYSDEMARVFVRDG